MCTLLITISGYVSVVRSLGLTVGVSWYDAQSALVLDVGATVLTVVAATCSGYYYSSGYYYNVWHFSPMTKGHRPFVV